MTYPRSKMLALLLNLIPGLGYFYWGRKVRAFLYPFFFFGGLFLGAVVSMIADDGELFLAAFIMGVILWCMSMLDLIIVMLRDERRMEQRMYGDPAFQGPLEASQERFFTLLLSFIPGLGHFQLGLMQRGLNFLILFFGLITMTIVITGVTHEPVFLLFLGLIPIIWLYCMFDAAQLIHRKQAGEPLMDRSLLDEWESGRIEGRRSKVLATLLSAFPGAGQMYLGLQKRGLQMMILFIGSFYLIDVLRIPAFLFLLPVIWCFSFFDGLQQTSRYGILPMEDIPLVRGRGMSQHWLGVILVLLGVYYVGTEFIVPMIDRILPDLHIQYVLSQYLRPVLIAVMLIGGGIMLMNRTRTGRTM
ncbi:hypothetical protein J41TS12_16310 [Paenibacillus antibioticophila]|uniref:Multi-TM2 domain-containing protein n=1 Tax=Paenibacillus antibioticophila TaxID=1274374 RepID=A0A919XUR8_9BACL|nr:hypothetical protein [Paenibacillus antibioticophila]GIO36770.1 hypothetical protein J41TS12_16310 [Paenibacillus antibioticophila]